MESSVWVYYSKDDISWVSSSTEEEAQNLADLNAFSHIYFFAELEELTSAA